MADLQTGPDPDATKRLGKTPRSTHRPRSKNKVLDGMYKAVFAALGPADVAVDEKPDPNAKRAGSFAKKD